MTTERDIGNIQVVHAIPGRIRLKVAQVRKNPVLASEIQTRLATVQGIRQVEVNPLTGSVLMLYEAQDAAAPDSRARMTSSFSNDPFGPLQPPP